MPEEYVDFIKTIEQNGGCLQFVWNNRDFPKCTQFGKRPTNRTPREIMEDVLKSKRVRDAVRQYAEQNKVEVSEADRECREIMEKMAHDFTLSNVRIFGYIITKVITTVFDEILVNAKKLRDLRKTFKDTPVVFIPTHRTYIDFLLLSVLCFDQEMTLPAIAAAMDFMNSKVIGEILRQCGAFFIRRAVGEDILYWALFTEYVQTHIVEGDRPVEFFIEGTRSRTNKSLPPKYGLLQILLEPYLRGNLFDMVVVPVTMSYDKILEEQLYAYELLGFPKPKESTSGLLKATSILNRRFGRVRVTFSDPISIREHLGVSIKRSTFVCQPDSQWKLTEFEKKRIRKFGHHIMLKHFENMAVTVWSVASSALLLLISGSKEETIRMGDFMKLTHQILDILHNLKVQVDVRTSINADLEASFKLHQDFITIEGSAENPDSLIRLTKLQVDQKKSKISTDILSQAVSQIILTNHANASMHRLSGPSIFSLALLSSSSSEEVKRAYCWLRSLLYSEFVHDPQRVEEEADQLIRSFTKAGLVEEAEGRINIKHVDSVEVLSRLTKSYLTILTILIDVLRDGSPLDTTLSETTSRAQDRIIAVHQRDSSLLLSYLSADVLKNAFNTLTQRGCLTKKARNFGINVAALNTFKEQILSTVSLSKRTSKL